MIPVQGLDGYYRDKFGAIQNLNTNEFEAYKAKKAASEKRLEKQSALEDKINNLEQDMGEIKHLLKSLLEIKNGANNN
jgi:hypothetical protein